MEKHLHTCTLEEPRATLQRLHTIFHFFAITSLLYYRFSHLFGGDVPFLAWGLITTAEVVFTFIWLFSQSFRWQPVSRSVNLENLPEDKDLPGVDVFICTSDPKKEPVVEVMNTVLSAMSLDYPPEKLSVYLSDDGGAAATLYAVKEACNFARLWVPFCRKYNIKSRSPEAYLSSCCDGGYMEWSDETKDDEENIKAEYDMLKNNVEKVCKIDDSTENDRPSKVEVIHNNRNKECGDDKSKMPLLVYVSREKRPSHPHHFKAGALNALLRVSGVMSNAPYMLVLDCDMYCTDPMSAQQAMCFHLDANISTSLSYVQFPQIFYNVSNNDIYDGQARSAYKTKYQGMDGIRGTVCSGTGYYMNKKALYCTPNHEEDIFVNQEKSFGLSTRFNDSLKRIDDKNALEGELLSDAILEEARNLTTCSFEENTRWGTDIGYSYESLLESTFTGYLLHSKGWRSVYLYPKRPAFLGCTTIDMKDAMIQLKKWTSGLVQVGFSTKFSPLTYGLKSNMPFLQSLCYGYFMFVHLTAVASVLYGVVPQLCFLLGVSLFPKVSDKWLVAFITVYLSSTLQHLYEVISSGSSILSWWNEQRVYFIRAVTGCLFGCVDALFKSLGVTKASLPLTNKAIDHEKLDNYEKGKFDFGGAKHFMIPLTLLVALNVVCFVGGVKGLISRGNYGEMFGQFLLSFYILVLSMPVLEGLLPKKGKGKGKVKAKDE